MKGKLTDFGRKLPSGQQEQALAVADVGNRLQSVAARLYPGISWKDWTLEMWEGIYEVAEEEWAQK